MCAGKHIRKKFIHITPRCLYFWLPFVFLQKSYWLAVRFRRFSKAQSNQNECDCSTAFSASVITFCRRRLFMSPPAVRKKEDFCGREMAYAPVLESLLLDTLFWFKPRKPQNAGGGRRSLGAVCRGLFSNFGTTAFVSFHKKFK